MKHVDLHYLKQARKHTHLSLQDMSFLLDIDVSNLSKYERGKRSAPLPVVLSYHILSRIPLTRFFRKNIDAEHCTLQSRIELLLKRVERNIIAPAYQERKIALKNLLEKDNEDICPEDLPL